MIKLLYFAGLRETLGTSAEEMELPGELSDVSGLRAYLAGRGEQWRVFASSKSLRAAVNQTMVGPDGIVRDGDEVAFFPPVTGG